MNAAIATIIAVVLWIAAIGAASAAPTPTGSPVVVPVITSTTGYLAFLGKQQAKALRIIEKMVNDQEGGINGRPLHFDLHDDQSSPQVDTQLIAALAAENAPVVLGPQITGGCNALAPIIAGANGPVMYCLSPAAQTASGSFGFVSNINTNDDAVAAIRYLRLRGWTRIAFLMTNDAGGQSLDKGFALALALPENRVIQEVAHEHFAIPDISVAAQLAKIKASKPQALIVWVNGTPLGLVLRSLRDTGMDQIPLMTSTGNMTYEQMAQYAEIMPEDIYFPSVGAMTKDGALTNVQMKYFRAFEAAGERPDYATIMIWDPALIVIDALRHTRKSPTAESIRAYINNLRNFTGTTGVYDFRDGSQRGIGLKAVVIDRWDKAKGDFVAVSTGGAYPK